MNRCAANVVYSIEIQANIAPKQGVQSLLHQKLNIKSVMRKEQFNINENQTTIKAGKSLPILNNDFRSARTPAKPE